ncbi:MAG: hypothetical protein GX856_08630 [Gammaproteobacteria bacterium]|jgi:hypothetical protein|nr:hypothetical protein [Gammaproteobacteria bacterium]
MGVLFARRLCRQFTKHDIPPTPTNRERVQAYRALAPVQLGNNRQWKWHAAAQYAREAVPSWDYDDQLREGAAFKYGDIA